MDQYKKIAKEFFEDFEGLPLYPRWYRWPWLLWLLAAIGAVLCAYHFNAPPAGVPMYLLMPTLVAAVIATLAIDDFKGKALRTRFPAHASTDAARISKLKKLLGKSPSEFSNAAQDLMQLIELSKKCGKQPLQIRQLFPIPWEKGQFVMHVLALAALIATTLGVLFPDTAKQIGQQIDSKMIGQFLGYIFLLILVSLTIYPMLRSMWHNAELAVRMWQARLQKGPTRTAVHLDYLLSNLVRLHEPRPVSINRPVRHLTPSSVRRRKLR